MKLHTALLACLCLFLQPDLLLAGSRGIVLVIADGTSLELLTAARIYQGGVNSRLHLDSLPQSAFVSTHSYDGMVTDSGAAATSMARGFKALNRAVGAPPPGQPSAPSILDLAKKAGWVTGVITDDSVTGGTPAPFLIEHPHREEEFIVANLELQQLGKNCDLLLGGGQLYYLANDPAQAEEKYRPVLADTQKRLAGSNIKVFDSWEKWASAPPSNLDQPVLGVFAPEKFAFIADGDRKPHLEDMVSEGLRLLQTSGKPWLLVIEAALPDKACHLNNVKRALEEVLVLDRTVALLLERVSPDTLLLVTTDHNTGGITLGPGRPATAQGDDLLRTSPITKLPVLTFATGPGGIFGETAATISSETDFTKPEAVSPALLNTGSAHHSGGNVWLLGQGPGSEKVRGFLDNTDIYKIIAAAISKS